MQMILAWAFRLVFIFLFLKWSLGNPCCNDQFRKMKFIPDLANDVESTDLKVGYAGKSFKCGSTVNIVEVSSPPTLYFDLPRRCSFATVTMFDPHSVVAAPFLLWLVINIPPDNLRKGFTTPFGFENTDDNGYIVSDYYIPRDPTAGSGVRNTNNTLVYFVYCQRSYNPDRRRVSAFRFLRGPFNVRGYAKKNNLGDPVAGLFHLFSPTGLTLPTLAEVPI